MSFSFGTTAGASQSSVKPRLVGNDIYDVTFEGCESQDIKGVKDANAVYKVLKLKFTSELGAHEHTIFEPRPEDFVRTETKYTDKSTGEEKKIAQTSGVENTMLLFKHAIDTINPKVAKQIDDNTVNLGASDWDGLRKLVMQILDAGKGVSTQIKLLRNTKGEAQFPGFFAGLTKEGKAYVKNNFIGNKLAFTAYEKTRIENEANAKPTAAKTYSAPALTGTSQSSEEGGVNIQFDMPIL